MLHGIVTFNVLFVTARTAGKDSSALPLEETVQLSKPLEMVPALFVPSVPRLK